MSPTNPRLSRRSFLGGALAGAAAFTAACGRGRSDAGFDARTPAPGPASRSTPIEPGARAVCVRTEDNIEGPFFKPGAPDRAVLVTGAMPGARLSIEGIVRDTACRPLAHHRLEVWQADHRGAYDNAGFGLRGTLRTDRDGRYRLDTIIPGRYLNGDRYRPAHIHVKSAGLTTQLYFPDDPYNDDDPFIRRSLIMSVREVQGGTLARFDFTLEQG
ncbi:MAG TPA: hypothetical protein VML75_23010 [Kofleriaceae bacterium]|nr:hypothetical protein [Kofleriaceae bacterium]